jgi:hypothetical protein
MNKLLAIATILAANTAQAEALFNFPADKAYSSRSWLESCQTAEKEYATPGEYQCKAHSEYKAWLAKERNSRQQAEQRKKPGVSIGDSSDHVIQNTHWGKPIRINRTTTASGVREQWVYGSKSYLYFTNGSVTAIQN